MTENSTQARNDVVRSGMTDNPEIWPHCLSERGKQNADAPPKNWDAICAVAQVRMGVALTEGQKRLVEEKRNVS